MENRDSMELLAVFAAGALIGVGATLLLKPEVLPRPVLRRLRESGRELGKQARRSAREVGTRGGRVARVGREMLEQLRGEAREIVGQAREELAQQVYAELRGARRRRHGGRRLKR
jgi:gas vesicle protein